MCIRDRHVADLSGCPNATTVDLVVEHDARADSSSDGQEDEVVCALGQASLEFANRGNVYIVIDECGYSKFRFEHMTKGNVTPAHQVRRRNQDVYKRQMLDHGKRYRAGRGISTGFVESAVNEIIAKRMVSKQQMRWNRYTVQKFLDVRVHVLTGTSEDAF